MTQSSPNLWFENLFKIEKAKTEKKNLKLYKNWDINHYFYDDIRKLFIIPNGNILLTCFSSHYYL